jgi:stress response protein YsnF
MQHTVIGIFRTADEANNAVEQLRSGGFSQEDIDVAFNEVDTPYSVNDENRYDDTNTTTLRTSETTSDTLNEDRIRERRRDNDEDEGFGDSIGRFFRRLFDNKEEAEKYSSLSRKNHMVTVYAHSSDEAGRAADILDECGALNLDESGTGSYTDTTSYTDAARTSARPDQRSSERDYDNDLSSEVRNDLGPDVTDRSIPIIEENLNVGKREVEQGGVRLRARIFERPVEERIRLREERVSVERNPVNRPATDEDFATFREGEVEMTERSEVPVVNKEARVVEEVRLNKEVTEREEVIGDTVRNTDVEVENLSKDETKQRRKRTK